MKKLGSVVMLAVGVLVALWVVVNSLLLQGPGPERVVAEKALRERLGVPESSGNEPGPPPMSIEEPPSDGTKEQMPEDLLERWRKVIEQVDGIFDRDDDPEIEYFRQRLCISYQWPIDWSLERMDVLEGFLKQNEALVHETVALTKLGIPSSSAIEELAISIAKESKDDEAIFVSGSAITFDFISLLTVASAIETRMGEFGDAGESLSAALRWVDKDTGRSWARGIDLTALDVSADGIFRSGALSAAMLSDMKATTLYCEL